MASIPRLNPNDFLASSFEAITKGDPPHILHGLSEIEIADVMRHYAAYHAEVAKLNTQISMASERFHTFLAEKLAAPRAARAQG